MDRPKRRVYYTNNKKEFNSPKKTYLNDHDPSQNYRKYIQL